MKAQNDFDQYLKKKLKNPRFKKAFKEAEKQLYVAYSIAQLRKSKKFSQQKLADAIGSTQSNIARIEAGRQNLTIETLSKIANALGKELEIRFV